MNPIKKENNTKNYKEIFSAKVVSFDIKNWSNYIVMLNAEQAANYWINDDDKISIIRKWDILLIF